MVAVISSIFSDTDSKNLLPLGLIISRSSKNSYSKYKFDNIWHIFLRAIHNYVPLHSQRQTDHRIRSLQLSVSKSWQPILTVLAIFIPPAVPVFSALLFYSITHMDISNNITKLFKNFIFRIKRMPVRRLDSSSPRWYNRLWYFSLHYRCFGDSGNAFPRIKHCSIPEVP